MKDIYITKYAVKGMKKLDDWVELSFYKNTFTKDTAFKGYNVKGIYGENGAGKSAIISSVRILKELLINPDYLSNSVVKKELDELVNKKLNFLEYDIEFFVDMGSKKKIYNYSVKLGKNPSGKYVVNAESLLYRNALSHKNTFSESYIIKNGDFICLNSSDKLKELIYEKTKNRLLDSTLVSYFCIRIMRDWAKEDKNDFFDAIVLYLLGCSIFVYLDSEDDHTAYLISESYNDEEVRYDEIVMVELLKSIHHWGEPRICVLHPGTITVPQKSFDLFERQVKGLERFLRIFKPQLKMITIDRNEDKNVYKCKLLIHYDDYTVNAEFESTGIKKLIRLYSYIKNMVNGDAVFIDELDSNLHDVYLCALLEYLMENGSGQLCFTTHNIGPMDILKRNKKSIDFLSGDGKIYQWVNNGNYSPSKLYREGMIEGSPFNVDSIDFIGVFEGEEIEK